MEYKLGEIASVKGGKRLPKGVNLITTPNTHPYIRVRDLNNRRTLELTNDYEYVDDETQKSIERYIVDRGNIILSIVGTIGLVAIVGETLHKANLTENCVKIVPTDDVDRDFLYYYLKSPVGQASIARGTVGAVQAKLPIKNIQDIAIWLPEIIEQKRIASVLACIDEKIEKNERINDNLLQQAQALFADAFPYAPDDELPIGWRKGTVGDIVDIHDSKRIPLSGAQRDKMTKRTYPYYGAASLMDYVDDYIFDGTYLLLGEDGTVVDDAGYPILQYVWGQFWVNNHAHILTGKNGFSVESLMLLFKRTPVKSIVTGAVQPKISQANLRSIPVVIPAADALTAFNALITPMFDQIRQNTDQNKTLAQLRDALLPKLMSGEIDVAAVQD